MEVSDVHAGKIECGESCHPGKKCVSNVSEGEHIFVDLSNADSPETSPHDYATKWVTIGDICLTVWDRKILETENRLNDQLINAAQKLLKKQHGVSGLQDTLLQQINAFEVEGSVSIA